MSTKQANNKAVKASETAVEVSANEGIKSVVSADGHLILDLAISFTTGIISKLGSKSNQREDITIEGHDELLVVDHTVPDPTRIKRIINAETGEVVGVLRRPNGMRRFEGTIDGVRMIGLESGYYKTMLIPEDELTSRGFTLKASKTVSELIGEERARLAAYAG